MAKLLLMQPLIVFWSIASPSHQVPGASTLDPMSKQAVNLVLGLPFYLHRLWRSSRTSTLNVGLQLGNMKDVMHTSKSSLQI